MSPQVEYLEAIVTCKGNYYAPDFPLQLSNLYSRLQDLVFQGEERSLILKKVEPWNSIRVTLKMPADAARRLKQLYDQTDSVLQTLGILAVQLEEDNSLNNCNNNNTTTFNSSSALNTNLNYRKGGVTSDKGDSLNSLTSDRLHGQISLSMNSMVVDSKILNSSTSSLEPKNKFAINSQNIVIKNHSVNQNIASSSPLLVNLLKSPGVRNNPISKINGLQQCDDANLISKKRKRVQSKGTKRFKQSMDEKDINNSSKIQSKDGCDEFKTDPFSLNNYTLLNKKSLESDHVQSNVDSFSKANIYNSLNKHKNLNASFNSLSKTNLVQQNIMDNTIYDTITTSSNSTCINTSMHPRTTNIPNNIKNSNMFLNMNNILRLLKPSTQSDINSYSEIFLNSMGKNKNSDINLATDNKDNFFDLKAIKDLEASQKAKIMDFFKPLLNGTSNLSSESSISTILDTGLDKNLANNLDGRISFSTQQQVTVPDSQASNLTDLKTEKPPNICYQNIIPNAKIINGCSPLTQLSQSLLPRKTENELNVGSPLIMNAKQEDMFFNKNQNIFVSGGATAEETNDQQNQNLPFNLGGIMPTGLNGEIMVPNLQQVTAVLKNLQKMKMPRPPHLEDPHRAKSNLTVAQLLEQVEIAKNNRSSPIQYVNMSPKNTSNNFQSMNFSLPRLPNNSTNKSNPSIEQKNIHAGKLNILAQSLSNQKNATDMLKFVFNNAATRSSSSSTNNIFSNIDSSRHSPESLPSGLKLNNLNSTPSPMLNASQHIVDSSISNDEQSTFMTRHTNHDLASDFEMPEFLKNDFKFSSLSADLDTNAHHHHHHQPFSAKEATCDEEGIKIMIASFYEAADILNNRKISSDAMSTDFIGIELGADDEANINDIIELKDYDEDIEKLVDSLSSSIADDENDGDREKAASLTNSDDNKEATILRDVCAGHMSSPKLFESLSLRSNKLSLIDSSEDLIDGQEIKNIACIEVVKKDVSNWPIEASCQENIGSSFNSETIDSNKKIFDDKLSANLGLNNIDTRASPKNKFLDAFNSEKRDSPQLNDESSRYSSHQKSPETKDKDKSEYFPYEKRKKYRLRLCVDTLLCVHG